MDCAFLALEGTRENKGRCTRRCSVRGCARLHNELLHRTLEENKSLSVPSHEEPPIRHRRQPEPLVEGSHVMQFTSNKSVRRSNQLSYEATDVGSWLFVSSNEPVKNGCEVIYEMFHILNCGV